MKKLITVFLLSTLASIVLGQDTATDTERELGISYYGELGLRPGLEIDYGYPLYLKRRTPTEKKNTFINALYLRPAVAYYYFPMSIDHFMIATKLNYRFGFESGKTSRQFAIEPYIKTGYLRTQYRKGVYESTDTGFDKRKSFGTNSFALGSGFDFTGTLTKNIDWLIGFDYFAEFTSDALVLHRFVAKLGTRIKI